MRAPNWADIDLRTVLEDYALDFEDKQGLPVEFRASGVDSGASLADEVRTAVYRIFQESLTNAWKHPRAQQVDARLELRPDRVRLKVRDDGVGFAVKADQTACQGHLGLVSMRERAMEVGGSFEIASAPDEGPRISVVVPLSS